MIRRRKRMAGPATRRAAPLTWCGWPHTSLGSSSVGVLRFVPTGSVAFVGEFSTGVRTSNARLLRRSPGGRRAGPWHRGFAAPLRTLAEAALGDPAPLIRLRMPIDTSYAAPVTELSADPSRQRSAGLPGSGGLAACHRLRAPWGGIQGNGVTATGLDLTAGPPRARGRGRSGRDPATPLRACPAEPFREQRLLRRRHRGAIVGKHVDVYDWRGRASQNAWGERTVSVTPAANPGAGNLLGGVAPTPPTEGASADGDCQPALESPRS